MSVTATEAKNRFGQLLDQAQRGPVFIEKSGRRHAVLLSIGDFERLLAGQRQQLAEPSARYAPEAEVFYRHHKKWVDEQRSDFDRHGVWNDEFRTW